MKRILQTSMVALSLGILPSSAAVTIAAWEFNTDTDFEGFVDFQNRGNSVVTGGSLMGLIGPSGNSDVQIRTQGGAGNPLLIDGAFLDIADYTELTFLITISQTDPSPTNQVGVAFANKEFSGAAANNIAGLPISANTAGQEGEKEVTAGANTFQTFTYDLMSILANDTTPGESGFQDSVLRSIRIDPTAGNSTGFSIDRLEIQGTAIPEPSAALLGGLGLLALVRRRR